MAELKMWTAVPYWLILIYLIIFFVCFYDTVGPFGKQDNRDFNNVCCLLIIWNNWAHLLDAVIECNTTYIYSSTNGAYNRRLNALVSLLHIPKELKDQK